MRRLSDLDQDAGAVAIIVALMMVVLIGMAAISIDVGALYLERRQLQNGADAAALAIAQECTIGLSVAGCGDESARLATAEIYADANAIDAQSSVVSATLNAAEQKVTVRTSTLDPSSADPSQLAHWFAPIFTLIGAAPEDVDATRVEAVGAAIFGSVSLDGEAHIPLTVGRCELEHWTSDGFYFPTQTPEALTLGNTYAFPPQWYQITDAGASTQKPPFKLEFQSGNPTQPAYCDPGMAGQNYPGGFGGLATDKTCTVESESGTVDGSEGQDLIKNADCKDYCEGITPIENGPLLGCDADPLNILGRVVYLPIFESYNSTSKVYNLQQPAAFFVTSYSTVHFKGTLPDHANCKIGNAPDCLEGYFTKVEVEPGEAVDVGGADTGIYSTQLVLE